MKKIKKNFRCLFQMDPLEKLNLNSDSSIALIKKGLYLGNKIWTAAPEKISFSRKSAYVLAHQILDDKFTKGSLERICLDQFDFFFIRQDPPFDINYLTNLYALELHNSFQKKPLFINHPSSIKNFTEKIFPFYFHDLMPYSVISSDEEVFKEIQKEHGTLVLKTLYNKGGEGIYKVQNLNHKSLSLFREMTNNYKTAIVIQVYVDEVKYGDKRVLLLDGEPMGVVNRVPQKGEFKANLHLGGKAFKSSLTKKEKIICKRLSQTLKKSKLFFVGIDIINEKLTEINVTSPTGIVQLEKLYKIDFCKVFWDKLCSLY
tara:strand:- start:232 stop:1179 length:948 start_codon:yes stop_codon:yes gene_type:complete